MKITLSKKTTIPPGKHMHNLRGLKYRYLRRVFWSLPPEKQEVVKAAANRYFAANKKFDFEPDPTFFREVILDVHRGEFQQEI